MIVLMNLAKGQRLKTYGLQGENLCLSVDRLSSEFSVYLHLFVPCTGVPLLSLYRGEVAYKGRNPNGIFDELSYFIKLLWPPVTPALPLIRG